MTIWKQLKLVVGWKKKSFLSIFISGPCQRVLTVSVARLCSPHFYVHTLSLSVFVSVILYTLFRIVKNLNLKLVDGKVYCIELYAVVINCCSIAAYISFKCTTPTTDTFFEQIEKFLEQFAFFFLFHFFSLVHCKIFCYIFGFHNFLCVCVFGIENYSVLLFSWDEKLWPCSFYEKWHLSSKLSLCQGTK